MSEVEQATADGLGFRLPVDVTLHVGDRPADKFTVEEITFEFLALADEGTEADSFASMRKAVIELLGDEQYRRFVKCRPGPMDVAYFVADVMKAASGGPGNSSASSPQPDDEEES